MEKRIKEFIADYIPKRVTKETRYKLQAELENHIYERIDYYTEIGYTEEDSLEKALKDFGDDKETKEQIKKNLENIHIPWSLADFFAKSIPITIAILFVGGLLIHILFKTKDLILIAVIPLTLWLFMNLLKNIKKLHHIVKSIIAFALVVPYFSFIALFYFVGTTHLFITFNDNNVIESYKDTAIGAGAFLLPHPSQLGKPIDSIKLELIESTIFSDPTYNTYIFEYSPTEYQRQKELFTDYFEKEPDFSAYNFDFYIIEVPFDNNYNYSDEYSYYDDDYIAVFGTNDTTKEISLIYSEWTSYSDWTSHSDTLDEFINECCGWRYFYFKHLI